MARDDKGWGSDLGGGDNRSDARVSDWARQPFNNDRSIYDPLPRDTRNPARPQNRQYNRYFPRSAKR